MHFSCVRVNLDLEPRASYFTQKEKKNYSFFTQFKQCNWRTAMVNGHCKSPHAIYLFQPFPNDNDVIGFAIILALNHGISQPVGLGTWMMNWWLENEYFTCSSLDDHLDREHTADKKWNCYHRLHHSTRLKKKFSIFTNTIIKYLR